MSWNLTLAFGTPVYHNLVDDTTHSYKYDAEGNLVSVDSGATAGYVYDALNRRVRVQTASATDEYIYDYASRRISTWLPNGAGIEGRIYWGSLLAAFLAQNGDTYFDQKDIDLISSSGTGLINGGSNNFTKQLVLTSPCGSSASQVMGAVEGNFAQFGNYSRWGGAESVTFSPPAGMGPGSTIPINVGILGFNQSPSVTVQSMNSQSIPQAGGRQCL